MEQLVAPETAVAQDACPQAAAAIQPFLGALVLESAIHPVTGPALLHAGKPDPLDFKLASNERHQVHAADEHIAPRSSGLRFGQVQFPSHCVKNFLREKRDLAFVTILESEIPIATDALPGHALDLVRLDNRVLAGRTTVVPDKVVARGGE